MESQTWEARVDALEHVVSGESGILVRLDTLSGEVSELRREMREEFAAVRGEMRGELAALRGEMRDEITTVVRREVAAGNEETRNYMRVLYEDAIARIAASRG